MPDFQPVRFGKYILLERLATGGMAQLYKAKITGIQGFEKLIAIKMILPHLAKEKELVVAFIDEAKLAALLNHQNIVQIYDFGSMEDSFFISMEYLFGNDLRAIWVQAREKNLPISLEYALYIMSRVCSGLAYAHELKDFQGNSLNIIHRDISPQNIFVTYQGDVKILDFGIAKAASQSTVTQCGMIKGKVAYMSPEQAAGKSIDQRSDIFSTGIVLYELIAHSKMFDGDSTIQILTRVRDAEYRPMQDVVAGLHPKVYAILDRALAKDPEQRYQSCSEMAADLEECIIELGLRPNVRGLGQYMKTLFDTGTAEDQGGKEGSGSLRRGSGEIKADLAVKVAPEKPKVAAATEPLEQKKPPEKAPEKAPEKVPEKAPEKIPEKPAEKAPPKAPEKVAQKVPAKPPEKAPEKVPDKVPEKVTEKAPDQAPKKAPEKPPEKIPDQQNKKGWIKYVAVAAVVVIAIVAIVLWQKGKTPVADNAASSGQQVAEVTADKPAETPADQDAAKEAEQVQEQERQTKLKVTSLLEQASQVGDKDPQKARNLLREAIALDAENVQAYFKLGLVYVKLKDYPRAIRSYTKAAELDPQFPDVYFNLGFAYGMNKDYAMAEEMYQRVVKMRPRYVDEALFNLAVVQEKQGKQAECLSTLEQAYAINPKNEVVKKYLDRMKGSGKKKP